MSPTGARIVPELELQHTYARAGGRSVRPYDLLKVGFFLFGFPRNGFGSIDVTKECNLRCRHCYFFEQDEAYGDDDKSIEEWERKLQDLKRTTRPWEFPFLQCTWVGGEPLLRRRLIEGCRKYFRYNTVVTNGTIPLPDWPDVRWYISIDGDEELHEFLRDKKGIYAKAMKNVRQHPHLNVTIAYCITKQNAHCVEKAVQDWAAAGARHMTFDFYTPIETIDHDLWLDFDDRDRMLDKLIALKRIYGDFFVLPERAFRLMKSDRCKQVTDDCLFASKSFAFGPQGTLKEKCMMGPKADCDRCGCVVPFYMASLVDRRMILEDAARDVARALARAPGRVAAWIS
jgi:sulfatase maturation enzyme AslB (radical SAM superfamily)